MDKPLISVILPVYNVEKYLSECMTSLFDQTYENLEFVMVDDGSTNKECSKMCDEFLKKDKRVVVFHKGNGGLSDARNYGIKKAKGQYVTCVDPDDIVDKDYVEYLYFLVEKYHCKMSICQHRVHYDNGNVKNLGSKGDEKMSNKHCLERMLYHDVIDTSAWAKLYRKDLFDDVEYPKGKLFEDIGTTYALMLKCDDVAVGYEAKYTYNFHNNSIVNGTFKMNKLDMIEMTDKMASDVLCVYPDLREAVLRRQVYSRLSTLNQMLNADGQAVNQKRVEIIKYVKQNSREVAKNPKTPKRDKIAFILLKIGYPLYRFCWLQHQKKIMNN